MHVTHKTLCDKGVLTSFDHLVYIRRLFWKAKTPVTAPTCQQEVAASKKLQLWNAPDVLVLKLNGFQRTQKKLLEGVDLLCDLLGMVEPFEVERQHIRSLPQLQHLASGHFLLAAGS